MGSNNIIKMFVTSNSFAKYVGSTIVNYALNSNVEYERERLQFEYF